jgi:hypothetical protein
MIRTNNVKSPDNDDVDVDVDVLYEDINVNNITFTKPFPPSKYNQKIKLGYLHKDLVIAPEAVYFYTFGIQKDMFDTNDTNNKAYNMCLCINLNDDSTKNEELRFCKNILNIYEKCREYLAKNKKELGLGENYDALKCPLYPAKKDGIFRGFRMYVKIPRNSNTGQMYSKFFFKPEGPEGPEEEITELPDDEIKKRMMTEGTLGPHAHKNFTQTPHAYYVYPSIIFDSIYIGGKGGNSAPVIQCKLQEAFVEEKPRKSTSHGHGPSLKTHFLSKKEGEGKHPKDQDLNINILKDTVDKYFNQTI